MIAAENTPDLSFTLTGLTPSTEYTVKMAAKAGDKILSDWFVGTVTTEGQEEMTFTITPYERYYKGNYIYPYADIKVSNPDVHYWVSAIPANNEMKPADWIKEDIQYYLDRGLKWDDLVTEGLILKGDTESLPFAMTTTTSSWLRSTRP